MIEPGQFIPLREESPLTPWQLFAAAAILGELANPNTNATKEEFVKSCAKIADLMCAELEKRIKPASITPYPNTPPEGPHS